MTTTHTNADRIDAGQLRILQQQDPELRIVDVRTGGEFQRSHIAGSYNVPLDMLSKHVGEFANVDCPVVLVCQSGQRATQAHQRLAAAGKDAIHVLEGGIVDWQATDGDVVSGESVVGKKERWAMDRQVRLVAGSLALAGVTASTVVPGAKWIAGGVAAGLTYSAVSNTCAMAAVLSKLPYNRTDDCDIEQVLIDLRLAPNPDLTLNQKAQ